MHTCVCFLCIYTEHHIWNLYIQYSIYVDVMCFLFHFHRFVIGNGNSKLTSVSLPTSLVAISDGAFSQCNALQTITIPTYVDYRSFFEPCQHHDTYMQILNTYYIDHFTNALLATCIHTYSTFEIQFLLYFKTLTSVLSSFFSFSLRTVTFIGEAAFDCKL